MSILPQNHSEFRTKQYWDNFFKKRSTAFEWYGDFDDVSPFLLQDLSSSSNILIVGCGNSNFSADLYDRGFQNLTNLDFSELVINEMRLRNVNRSKMVWDVGDMTNMKYADGTFDVVFDKGALDALMSVESLEVKEKALSMFSEICRLLPTGGVYICITLAEKFIIESLMSYFCSTQKGDKPLWDVQIHAISSKRESPFVPFLIAMKKILPSSDSINDPMHDCCVKMYIGSLGRSTSSSSSIIETTDCERVNAVAAVQQLVQIQEYNQKQYQLGKLEIGRFETMQFWHETQFPDIPRFTVFVLDCSNTARLSMAVFMVPFGRESDYQFTTADGLKDIAEQANCRRLLAVCCNRPHVFPEMSALQAELSPLAMSLRLKDMQSDETIPFMAINNDSDWDQIDHGVSAQSGDFIIEESEAEGNPNAVLRRLIFLKNQNFIQTEVRLVLNKKNNNGNNNNGSSKSKGKKKGKSGTKASKKAKKGEPQNDNDDDNEEEEDDLLIFDYSYLDAHHCAAITAMVLLPPAFIHCAHRVSPPTTTASTTTTTTTTAVLIGLGGGALPMILQRYLPNLHLYVCDMDDMIECIAKKHFGFHCNHRTTSFLHEGVALINYLYQHHHHQNQFIHSTDSTAIVPTSTTIPSTLLSIVADRQQQLDVLFIDADSKDTSLGISAPPPGFITISTLLKIYSLLRPGGALFVNVVARSRDMFENLIAKLCAVFAVNIASSSPLASAVLIMKEEVAVVRNSSDNVCSNSNMTAAITGVGYRIRSSEETVNEGLLFIKGTGTITTAAANNNNNSTKANTAKSSKPKAPAANISSKSALIDRTTALESWLKVFNAIC